MKILRDGNILLTIGFSPCPNDTFIFDALVNGRIDTGRLRFEAVLEDVESLNLRALGEGLDISKLSFGAFARLMDRYQLLNAGSALGTGVGPLLVTCPGVRQIRSVAVPGLNTTANFLFSTFYPEILELQEIVFSGIEDAVLDGRVDAGVIIHENRFTYEEKGLVKVADLGELWERSTGRPIPLGGIAVKRSIPYHIRKEIDRLVRKSLEHAWMCPSDSNDYITAHAQAMDPEVRMKHISLYVNDYSLDLGESGRSAIRYLLGKSRKTGTADMKLVEPLFVEKDI